MRLYGLLNFTKNEITYENQDLPNLVIRRSMLKPKVKKVIGYAILWKQDAHLKDDFVMLSFEEAVGRI